MQSELGTHAKSMKPMSKLTCKSKNKKLITHWVAVFAIILKLGTKAIKMVWPHLMMPSLISLSQQAPRGINLPKNKAKVDLFDWATQYGIKLNFCIAQKGYTTLGSHACKNPTPKALTYYKNQLFDVFLTPIKSQVNPRKMTLFFYLSSTIWNS